MPKKGSQVKRLKCSGKKPLNKYIKRLLKHFNNIKDFSDPSQKYERKRKRRKGK